MSRSLLLSLLALSSLLLLGSSASAHPAPLKKAKTAPSPLRGVDRVEARREANGRLTVRLFPKLHRDGLRGASKPALRLQASSLGWSRAMRGALQPLQAPASSPLSQSWAGQPSGDDLHGATDSTGEVPGSTQPRFKMVYARPADAPDRFTQYADAMQFNAWWVSTRFLEASRSELMPRFDLGTQFDHASLDILQLALPRARAYYESGPGGSGGVFRRVMEDLQPLVQARMSGVNYPYNVLVQLDGIQDVPGCPGEGGGGRAQVPRYSSEPNNPHFEGGDILSSHASDGGVYSALWSCESGNFTPNNPETRASLLHEILHNLGGVTVGQPHSTFSQHCWQEADILCYPDTGGFGNPADCSGSTTQTMSVAQTQECARRQEPFGDTRLPAPDCSAARALTPSDREFNSNLQGLDCGQDDYFRPRSPFNLLRVNRGVRIFQHYPAQPDELPAPTGCEWISPVGQSGNETFRDAFCQLSLRPANAAQSPFLCSPRNCLRPTGLTPARLSLRVETENPRAGRPFQVRVEGGPEAEQWQYTFHASGQVSSVSGGRTASFIPRVEEGECHGVLAVEARVGAFIGASRVAGGRVEAELPCPGEDPPSGSNDPRGELRRLSGNGLTGSRRADRLAGGSGSDALIGLGSADRLRGGPGGDLLAGGSGNDRLYGQAGHDMLGGEAGNDRLMGEAGNDVLSDGSGRDYLSGGAGRDRLYGGAGRDRLDGGEGNDLLAGDDESDRLRGGAGSDSLYGGGQADSIQGGEDDDTIAGQLGDDSPCYKQGKRVPDETPSCSHAPAAIIRASGADAGQLALIILLRGGYGDDLILGGEGADSLSGDQNDDTLYGGEGTDLILGGSGDDRLYGGPGDDMLVGGAGADLLLLGPGDDLGAGGPGNDVLQANDGVPSGALIDCGEGLDTLILDGADLAARPLNCENIRRNDIPFSEPEQPSDGQPLLLRPIKGEPGLSARLRRTHRESIRLQPR